MSNRVDGLHLVGKRNGRAHLAGHGARELAVARLEAVNDPLQEGEPFVAAGLRIGGERPSCRGDGAIDVGARAKADLPGHLLGRRVDDVEKMRRLRVNPRAVNIEFGIVVHDLLRFPQPQSLYPSRYIRRNITTGNPATRRVSGLPRCSARRLRFTIYRIEYSEAWRWS